MAPSIVELARQVLDKAKAYEQYFPGHNLSLPSFGPEAYPEPPLPPEILAIRESIVATLWDLQSLVRGPRGSMMSTLSGVLRLWQFPHFACLQALYRYKVATHIPIGARKDHTKLSNPNEVEQQHETPSISYADLANACGLKTTDVRRFLRYMMTWHVFYEPRPGFVTHNAASMNLASDPVLHAYLGMLVEEMWPASTRAVDAIQKWPRSEEPNQTGFQLAHNTDKHFFDEITSNPFRSTRFSQAMSILASHPGMNVSHTVSAYPWAKINNRFPFTLVDVGGSHGDSSIALAREFPQMTCIVQDLAGAIDGAQVPVDLHSRLRFEVHNFFEPQQTPAEVYLLRQILHYWPDKKCVQILQALSPALKVGARVVINETCLPEPGVISKNQERNARVVDLGMLSAYNAKERDFDDWKQLLNDADPRFRFEGIRTPTGSMMALLEFIWTA